MAKYDDELQVLYRDELQPIADSMQKVAKNAIRALWRGVLIAFCISIFLGGLAVFPGQVPLSVVVIAGTVLIVLAGLISYLMERNGRQELFQSKFVPAIVRHLDPELSYLPESGLPEDSFRASSLFNHPIHRFHARNLIQGRFQGIPLAFSYIKAEYKVETPTKNGSITTWHTIFDGTMIVTEYNKNFSGMTWVLPDFAESVFGGLIGNFLQKSNFSQPGEMTRMEDPEFEKLFVVYTTDQVEARYLLTPKIMEKMVKIRNFFQNKVAFAFVNQVFYVAVSECQTDFSCPFGPVSYADAERVYFNLTQFAGIITELELNLRLWSKQ